MSGGEALIDFIDDLVLSEQEMACFRLWVWMEDVDSLPRREH
jgi:hypothetical protein